MSPVSSVDPGQPCRLLLVVEDEPMILEFLCEILQDEGFATQAMPSADEALQFLESHPEQVRLLLTDINMPGTLNGAGLANRVRERWPGMPVLVMSGYETPQSSGIRYPVAFIRKPWTIGQILDSVDEALNRAGDIESGAGR
ncbi:response regulator [Pseudomonas chlororaphis]|uniref:Response regulator n=1 Tax=Pseudomonas chlororaphis TaxID=587753 RepID=A0AAX3G530_9PSED|nr:response regulator [Pseudomonas chlororaphis]AZC36797.1 sensor histidine kinase/response regulator [Pseudomonas chlororaphis subsp. piscium]AZC43343.1 sensor histidine kinase/response regulator [Pseudomonas chlororaphis subsp. piscium]AZC50034.1 sensor histidine kinase/response regulator [Pseudomonas chlororaphis subsp. piscium]AZC56613.1 sensor histidine kinase/response regulator [Pseudomonas chlororaphis subsp. piscium]AZC62831.1 sensor histidine kinase/response regulator [Pseudomonas chl